MIFGIFVKVDIESEYDLIQLIGEGWISKLYLAGNCPIELAIPKISYFQINNQTTIELFMSSFKTFTKKVTYKDLQSLQSINATHTIHQMLIRRDNWIDMNQSIP